MRLLLNLLLFTCLVSCNNPKLKTTNHNKISKDSVSISSNSIKDTFTYSKKEFEQILELHPEISLYPPLHPDLAYNKNYIGFIDETGKDVYYTIYAYLLKEKNKGRNFKRLRKELIEAFLKINYIHAYYKRGGSGFSHQKPRIAAFVEFSLYQKSQNKNLKHSRFEIMKEEFLTELKTNMNQGIVKLKNMPNYAKERKILEIGLEIKSLDKLIKTSYILEEVKLFEGKYYNYNLSDLLW